MVIVLEYISFSIPNESISRQPQLEGPAKHYLFTEAQVRQLAKSNSYDG
jgi:hypothetical protein